MDDARKSANAGERAAEGLREASAQEEAKIEGKTGQDLAKGADRFEERSKSSDGKRSRQTERVNDRTTPGMIRLVAVAAVS
jgi:hypothetical protein